LKVTATGSSSTESHIDQGKKIIIIARLVHSGSLPVSELGKIKAYMLNAKCEGINFCLYLHIIAFSVRELELLFSAEIEIKFQIPGGMFF
jgi:hypothetical protein